MKTLLIAITASALSLSLSCAEFAVGDAAPAFEANDQDGNAVTSTEFYKEGTTLIFFYPKAGTGG